MKLNRTDWLVLIGAAVLIIVVSSWPTPPPQTPLPATAGPAAIEPAKSEPGKPATGVAPAPGDAGAATAVVPEQEAVLQNSGGRLHFHHERGRHRPRRAAHLQGSGRAQRARQGRDGRALGGGMNQWDDLNYRIVSQTGSGIVFEAEAPDRLVIRKEYYAHRGQGWQRQPARVQAFLHEQGRREYHARQSVPLHRRGAFAPPR